MFKHFQIGSGSVSFLAAPPQRAKRLIRSLWFMCVGTVVGLFTCLVACLYVPTFEILKVSSNLKMYFNIIQTILSNLHFELPPPPHHHHHHHHQNKKPSKFKIILSLSVNIQFAGQISTSIHLVIYIY